MLPLIPCRLKGQSLDHVKIADFGLSEFYRPGGTLTSTSGTLSFQAPEVISGVSHAGKLCGILWSMLWNMMCGVMCGMLTGRLFVVVWWVVWCAVSGLLSGLCGQEYEKRHQDRLACLHSIHPVLVFMINVASSSKMLTHNMRLLVFFAIELQCRTSCNYVFNSIPSLNITVSLHASNP